MSIHIGAKPGEIADRVLMPGDPLRAKHIAETFLEGAVCYTQVRGMYGFIGTYKGKRVSVQGSGMGMPSMHIYASELMQEYGAKRIIRVGTCGGLRAELKLKDVVIASAASTDSNINKCRFGPISFAPSADFELLLGAYQTARERGMRATVGPIFTSDRFYSDDLPEKTKMLADYGILAVEMETCELYTLAAKHHIQALTLLTVSDNVVTDEITSPEERQTSFNDMVELALEIV
ncbi:purine-nucleoside phosphorylase [Anaerotruncus massiliensis (ex Liu et al. 2021)]|uniref:Purine nucleoside phosphorylase DeoD-type n=2 Tax=Anaerotruncus TaxID=244127 RepID=A0A498CX04_9FIRM|nr:MULTISPECIES: purine-nucleoside phosphorylase [Anaerotruncus]MBC3937932.1 purine-nucleoside phosphorylase [Anaerotruncus massiliensis (ex Togo et al. 2019)]RLL13509.1 purine-nucleoside phosphorylase [Anaerotruncus massiliensis (ex Liu et al. 2021)]